MTLIAEWRTDLYGIELLEGINVSCLGICSDFLAEPFHRFRRSERSVIRRHIKELGLMENRKEI